MFQEEGSVSLGDLVPIGAPAERKGASLNSLKAPAEGYWLVPVEIRPHVGTALAASCADKPRFDIRKPHVIIPLVRRDRDIVAAPIIRAVDQEPAHPG
jgi:hypothetical protein